MNHSGEKIMVKTFAVIGDPIDHSLSPNIHNAAFRELELDCTYIAYRIPKDELGEGIESLKKINISGFNVTIPHKIEILSYLDKVDEGSSLIGAANTVANRNGVLKGYNTDMDGFLEPILKRKLQISNKNVLVLGAGGAARAIVAAFSKQKANSITIANRTKTKAEEISQFANKIGIVSCPIDTKELEGLQGEFDFIVNSWNTL